jgi:uncharacterized protein (UPF0264 family)
LRNYVSYIDEKKVKEYFYRYTISSRSFVVVNQRILVSVRGRKDAVEAVAGGAHIIDVEYPGSALGTPYPLNIHAVRTCVPKDRLVATNVGEKQHVWATASQAALGVAIAGADIIKVGLAGLPPRTAAEVMKRVVRNVKKWAPLKKLVAALFADNEFAMILDPVNQSQQLGTAAKVDGLLIDTFFKERGKGLLDYIELDDIRKFAERCHQAGLEAWIAGSITKGQMSDLWLTGVDVICIRQAATEGKVSGAEGVGRMGKVSREIVGELVRTIPYPSRRF